MHLVLCGIMILLALVMIEVVNVPNDRVIDTNRFSPDKNRELVLDFIKSRDLVAGDKVPSERTLSEALGISRRAVSDAINRLVSDGILESRPRSGTYLAEASSSPLAGGAPTIAVVMPWLAGRSSGYESTTLPQTPLFRVPFGSESMTLQIMHGIVAAANEHSARIVTYANNSPEEELDIFRRLESENVDGIIVMPRRELTGTFSSVVAAGTPLVFIDHYFEGVVADRVVTANKDAAKEAVAHLISEGHTRIAFFTSFSDMTSIVDRAAGYKMALEAAGINYDTEIVRGYEIMPNHDWGYELALAYCTSLKDPITAVFCVDDFAVEKTLAAANKLGIKVPGQLSIAGFFEYQIPESIPIPFTRVIQDKFTIGQTAARLLLERISGETQETKHIEVSASLVPANL